MLGSLSWILRALASARHYFSSVVNSYKKKSHLFLFIINIFFMKDKSRQDAWQVFIQLTSQECRKKGRKVLPPVPLMVYIEWIIPWNLFRLEYMVMLWLLGLISYQANTLRSPEEVNEKCQLSKHIEVPNKAKEIFGWIKLKNT